MPTFALDLGSIKSSLAAAYTILRLSRSKPDISGYVGSIGFSGSVGMIGVSDGVGEIIGSSGLLGTSDGVEGTAGVSGKIGSSGCSGTAGVSGRMGSSGCSGSVGVSGTMGSFGSAGELARSFAQAERSSENIKSKKTSFFNFITSFSGVGTYKKNISFFCLFVKSEDIDKSRRLAYNKSNGRDNYVLRKMRHTGRSAKNGLP